MQQPLEEALRQFDHQVRDETRTAVANALRQLNESIRPAIEAEIRAGQERMKALLRREVVNNLLFVMRRMRSAESLEAWRTALLDGVSEYTPKVALFAVEQNGFRLEDARNASAEAMARLRVQRISKEEAGAFAQLLESRDTVVALLTASQVSPQVTSLFESTVNRVNLFPLLRGDKVVAVLYCLGNERALDVAGLELLSLMAGETLTNRTVEKAAPEGLIALDAKPVAPMVVSEPIHRDDQDAHLKAARWAKANVARMFLDHTERIHAARRTQSVYAAMSEHIEQARKQYQQEFMRGSTSMPDFLHKELIETLAGGDEAALGEEYPGPLL